MDNLPAKQQANTIRTLLDKSKHEIERAVPKHVDADRLLRIAMTSIQTTPKLLNCTPTSLLACVMESAQLGLPTDGVLGHAYLVPYKNTATLQIGYRGLLELAWRSGKIQELYAYPVYENDEYSFKLGLNRDLVHVPAEGERGECVGAYAVVRLKDGGLDFEPLVKSDIDKIMKSSKAYIGAEKYKNFNSPWHTHYDEMARKTAIRALAKRLPLSTDFQRAAVVDEYHEQGIVEIDTEAPIATLEQKILESTEPKLICEHCGWDKATSERGLKKHVTQQHTAIPKKDGDKEPPVTMITPEQTEKLFSFLPPEQVAEICMWNYGKELSDLSSFDAASFIDRFDEIFDEFKTKEVQDEGS